MHSNEVRSILDVFPNNPNTMEFHRKDGQVVFIAVGKDGEDFGYVITNDRGKPVKRGGTFEDSDAAFHAGMKEAACLATKALS